MDLATSLIDQGDEVRICTRAGDLQDDFRRRGIETYKVKYNPFSYRKLLAFLREYDPDLVHIQSLRSLTLGRRLAGRIRKPYVVTVHRRPGPSAPQLRAGRLRGVIVLNELIREALVNDQALAKNLIRVIRRGVRIIKARPEPSSAPRKRIPVVGSVGRLSWDKGHHCLIAAAAKVLERGVEAHFAIVGEGEEESRLRALVKDLNLEYHVTFSPHISKRRDLYGLFDIVALPVLSSGVGVTAIEAMSMGKPLVASAVGEMLHLVQDGRTGLLVAESDSDELADRIIQLIENPALMGELGRQGRSWVEENFVLEPMVNATRNYYEEVLSGLGEEL